ncbi:MAG TPA: FHA domain-containing protein [Kofleriaceae bacterium]|nr:FHA domain-containing protein [Kofleriaceae bacterium]
MSADVSAWLELSDGVRLAIKPDGVLVGRAPNCDVVLAEPSASRVQAIIFAGASGPSLAVLGKGATAVNDETVTHDRELVEGDRISLPGLEARIVVEPVSKPVAPASTWVVRGPGGLFGVVRSPFTIGSARDADLRLDGAPPEVLRFHIAERLTVEARVELVVDDESYAVGELAEVRPRSVVVAGGIRFEVVAGGTLGDGSTASDLYLDAPGDVRLEFLARGGRLTVHWRARERTVYLPERRCDLVAALLQPPDPYEPGDDIPDDVLLPRVWPGKNMTRADLNVLLHRARNDLLRADLDGAALLPRAEGGTATRFLLASRARVTVG